MRISKLAKSLEVVDNVRSLTKTSAQNAISDSIKDLSQLLADKVQWCLCGGLAVGIHARPRGTDDIDILLQSDSVLQYVYAVTASKFKRESDHMIVHRRTGVAVDLVTPEFVKISPEVVNKAIETAKISVVDGLSVPAVTREALVALKLNRGKYMDLADIESIIRSGGDVDMSNFPLTEKQREDLQKVRDVVNGDTNDKA